MHVLTEDHTAAKPSNLCRQDAVILREMLEGGQAHRYGILPVRTEGHLFLHQQVVHFERSGKSDAFPHWHRV